MSKLWKRALKVFMLGGALGALAGMLTPPKSRQPLVEVPEPEPEPEEPPEK